MTKKDYMELSEEQIKMKRYLRDKTLLEKQKAELQIAYDEESLKRGIPELELKVNLGALRVNLAQHERNIKIFDKQIRERKEMLIPSKK